MSAARPLDRAVKLVALASSPVEEEARTAAYLACKLIREQRLVLLEPTDPRLQLRAAPTPPPPPPPEPSPGRWITSRYDGTCRACGNPYAEGERVWWVKGEGSRCKTCKGQS